MEFINEVTLQGIVGNIRVNTFNGVKMARLSLLTNRAYASKDGTMVVDTTWHNVIAWDNPDKPDAITDLNAVSKGDKIHVTGYIHNSKYTDMDGIDRTVTEIKATTLAHVK